MKHHAKGPTNADRWMKKQRQRFLFNGWSDQLQGVGTFSAKAHALATPNQHLCFYSRTVPPLYGVTLPQYDF
jgi:hypothetical protein